MKTKELSKEEIDLLDSILSDYYCCLKKFISNDFEKDQNAQDDVEKFITEFKNLYAKITGNEDISQSTVQ